MGGTVDSKYSEDHERAGNAPMMLRHAVHIMSRSPSFPGLNLLQHPSALAPAARVVYEEMRPLLDAAGYGSSLTMTESDEDAASTLRASARMRMPWKQQNFALQVGQLTTTTTTATARETKQKGE